MQDELYIVEEVPVVGDGQIKFRLSLAGVKAPKPPTIYVFSDGYSLQPYPMQANTKDYSLILRGCSDVTGEKFRPYYECIGAVRGLNSLELAYNTFTCKEGDPALERIRAYQGPLNTDPKGWPEPYRTAYLESH